MSIQLEKAVAYDLKQGTPEWLEWRMNYIGGSEASVIMGTNRYTNVVELFERKLGLIPEVVMNEAMARGHRLEPEARVEFELETGISVVPACFVSTEYDFMAASLDGINIDGTVITEIKCPGLKTHSEALGGRVPLLYYPQLQHQLAVTGARVNYYWSYTDIPDIKNVLIEQLPDEEFIARMIAREQLFSDYFRAARAKLTRGLELNENDYPPLQLFDVPDAGTNRTEIIRTDPKWLELAKGYRAARMVVEDAVAQLRMQEDALAAQMARKKQVRAEGGGIVVVRELQDNEWKLVIDVEDD